MKNIIGILLLLGVASNSYATCPKKSDLLSEGVYWAHCDHYLGDQTSISKVSNLWHVGNITSKLFHDDVGPTLTISPKTPTCVASDVKLTLKLIDTTMPIKLSVHHFSANGSRTAKNSLAIAAGEEITITGNELTGTRGIFGAGIYMENGIKPFRSLNQNQKAEVMIHIEGCGVDETIHLNNKLGTSNYWKMSFILDTSAYVTFVQRNPYNFAPKQRISP